MCFLESLFFRSKGCESSGEHFIEQTPNDVNIIKNNTLITDAFSSYLVIFPVTLHPFLSERVTFKDSTSCAATFMSNVGRFEQSL